MNQNGDFIQDYLNDQTDPRGLTNIVAWCVEQIKKLKQTKPPTRQVPEGGADVYDPNCVVITDENGVLATDPSLEYVEGSTESYTPGSQISTGTVAGNDSDGVEIAGLTIGEWYAIEGTGGPFLSGGTALSYSFRLSNDGGAIWEGQFGLTATAGFKLELAPWTPFAEAVDSQHARVYFQATTTSIRIRCNETVFVGSTGSIGYKLLNATYAVGVEKEITLDDVEYTLAKLAGAIHAATQKTTPISTDELPIRDSATGQLRKILLGDFASFGGGETGSGGEYSFSANDVSNPPTEAELITAFGSPDTDSARIVHLLDDNHAQTNSYVALAVAGHWWLLPLTAAVQATPSVTVDSTATLRTAAGEWYGRAAMKVVDGVVVLVYRHGSAHNVNDGELHIKFSDDYGDTWSDEDKYLDGTAITGFPMNPSTLSAGEDAGEPWLYLAPNGDLVLHMWRADYGVTANGTYASRSSNGGRAWSTPVLVDFGGIADDLKVFSTDDDFVLDGEIYAGARIYSDVDGTPCASALIKSPDGGYTWELVSIIMANNEGADGQGAWEVGLEYLGNDTIIASLRGVDSQNAYQRMSTDRGFTWGALTNVTATLGIVSRARIYTRSHLKGYDSWWNDRVLIMVGFYLTTPGDSQTRKNAVWISPDAGTTWTKYTIDNNVGDGGYGDMVYNPNTGQYVVVSYQGSLTEADLIQYNLTIGGL